MCMSSPTLHGFRELEARLSSSLSLPLSCESPLTQPQCTPAETLSRNTRYQTQLLVLLRLSLPTLTLTPSEIDREIIYIMHEVREFPFPYFSLCSAWVK